MANFKLYLLNTIPSNRSSSMMVTRIPISEFEIISNQYEDNLLEYWTTAEDATNINKEHLQKRQTATLSHNPYFCYTSDEKFQLHQNTQRTLTFSMVRDIIREDRIEKNPFINYLYIGAQILLEDKYNNHHLMTVSKISYEFHPWNTVFKYECQDSFNYQLSRQNAGYEIINNIEDVEFIGAKPLDWWVLCKIQPECNISYQYIQLNQTLGKIKTIAYSKEKYPEFHKTIPFAASGTANSVLIALGEQYGLQLHVYEYFKPESDVNSSNGTIEKYYWFEPMKSLRPSGLKYSPDFNLQSFGLEHVGTSFSSILNVQTNTVGEDLITMIPTVPAFFRAWFETAEWTNSKFAPGLFLSACQEQSISWDIEESNIGQYINTENSFIDGNYLYIPIPQDIIWDRKYDQIKFSTNGGLHSVIHISGIDSKNNNDIAVTYNSKYRLWSFGTYDNNATDKFKSLSTPTDCMNHSVWIQLELPSVMTGVTAIGTLYLSQYREPTTEELEFAKIADQIPWLENRLVDFKYFYDHSIINLQQYHDIMSIFENDLRKANAKLLLYSQLYYQSIQAKTKIMANLSAQLDMVGATFQSDLVKPFQIDGRVKATTEFQLALSDLFSNKDAAIELIDYYTTLADYVNKYVSSEQNFLKNMYLFRKYFYEPCGIGNLYQYIWTLKDDDNFHTNNGTQYKYAFTNRLNNYEKLTSDNYQKNIFIHKKNNDINTYTAFDKNNIVTDPTNSKYYYLNPKSSEYVLIDSTNEKQYAGWNKDATYYELQWEIDSNYGQEKSILFANIRDLMKKTDYYEVVKIIDSGDKKFKLESLEKDADGNIIKIRISCYQHCLHTIALNDNNIQLGSLSGIDLSKNRVYIKTNFAEMRQNYFYQTLKNKSTILYEKRFIHRHLNDFVSLLQYPDWRTNFDDLGLAKNILEYLPNMKNENPKDINADVVYAQSFPLTSWYYYGKKSPESSLDYHSIPFVNIENCSSFMRRVSVGAQERTNWLVWSGIFTLGLSHAICSLVWNNGNKDFGNDGWTYHDVFNNDISSFQGYYTGNEIVYTPNSASYNKAISGIDSSKDGKRGFTIDDFESWGYDQAAGLLFTYRSFLYNQTKVKSLGGTYRYQPSYWRILTLDDTIAKTDNLMQISLTDDQWIKSNLLRLCRSSLFITKDEKHDLSRLDSIEYYPLANMMSSISGADLIWKDSTTNTMVLSSNYETHNATNKFWIKETGQGNVSPLMLLKEEDFVYEDFTEKEFNYNTIVSLSSSKYYDNKTMQPVDLIQLCPDIVVGYYVTGLEDDDYLPLKELIEDGESNIDNYEIYEKIDNAWVRRYIKNQFIARNDTYVRIDNVYKYDSFTPVNEINIQCYRYRKNHKEEWVFDAIVPGQIDNITGKLKIDNSNINLDCQMQEKLLSNYSNAEYWYNYRNSETTILAEKAMLIETNLTEYWTNAYYASKNCKYFLPEFWQPTVDQTKNYYSVNILSPKYEERNGSDSLKSVDLSTTYVPVVAKLNGQNKFQFRHISQVNDDQTVAMEQQYGLPLSEHVSLYDIINKSTPIKDIMDYLNISTDAANWVGINIANNYVLYEHVSGGRLWTKELQTLSGNSIHYPDKFGGWYDMMIKVLISCNYKNYSPVLYDQAQEEHNRIWAQLYAKYPYLLLEQSYSNENATTATELIQMAQHTFKDYTQVESNYNITVIDPWTLKGYKGQELQIGDGIEVDATELYDDHDSDIYRSLIQYLYITDISYDLRRDDNIQLTVNSIKYQDKVIGQLIKLIR